MTWCGGIFLCARVAFGALSFSMHSSAAFNELYAVIYTTVERRIHCAARI